MNKEEILSLRLRKAVAKDVGLAGILLYVPCVIVDTSKDPDKESKAAWTDGVKMYFGDKFFEYPEAQQMGIIVHEGLHVAFRHVQRGMTIHDRSGDEFQSLVWNWAVDAVVNQSLRQTSWFELPKGSVYPENLVPQNELHKKPAEQWTAEEFYKWAMTHNVKKKGPGQGGKDQKGQAGKDNQRGQGSGDGIEDTPMSEDVDMKAGQKDSSNDPHQREVENQIWRERLVRAQQGSQPGSILRKLNSDIPAPKIRWEKVLREFIVARCMPTTEQSWCRPSRRTLSQGKNATWIEAGIERQKGVKKVGIVIDTSGSINDEILRIFMGEINGIMQKTGCEVVLVDCDAAVHQVTTHREPIKDYKPKGGGGTDFRPAVKELESWDIVVAVYLTDLCGTFPEKPPKFPMLWCATMDLQVPWGKKVLIPMDK